MFHVMFSLPCLYVLVRWLVPLPWPLFAKLAVAAVLLVASQYHLWSRLSSGSVFAPEFPRSVVIGFNVAFGAMLFLAIAQIAADLIALGAKAFGRDAAPVPLVRYLMAGAAVALAGFAVAQAIRVPPLHDVEVRIAGLPPEYDGYRLVQLTDLHISRLFPGWFAEKVVADANALDADLIVVTGDFIDGTLAMRRADVEPLRALRARDGVIAIPGNHEYFFGYEQWMAHFAGMGMRVLANGHEVLTRGGGRLVVAGVTDLSAPQTGRPGPDLAAALAGRPAGVPVVLLDHQPARARAAAAAGVALQLSGHTHGGMIAGLDRIVARANGGFVSRRYQVGDMTLYVSNGTMLWPGFALRLGPQAELTRFTLRRGG